jgi:hypothetical protein
MGYTRRELLAGTAATTAALAGCGSDGGDGGDGNGEPADVAAFREEITSELAVSIERLERQAGTVHLRYRSNYATETESWGYEVGYICGRFGRVVVDGWELTVDATGEDGPTAQQVLAADCGTVNITEDGSERVAVWVDRRRQHRAASVARNDAAVGPLAA